MIDLVAERAIRRTLESCDVEVGGRRPWDLRVLDPAFYRRMAWNAPFELGETYLDGLWECDALDDLLARLVASPTGRARGWKFYLRDAKARLGNPQSRARAKVVAEHHYDGSLELFRAMLDAPTMSYTCAYFRPGDELADAQRNKLAMLCDKLELRAGETLLDVGCGFGGLAAFAAERYGVRVVGITNSVLHHRVAQERAAGRDIAFELIDYRALPSLGARFDKIVSVEMIEAVGPKNYATYMRLLHALLRPGGRLVVQAFISRTSQHVCNEWFDRYVFPNGVSPSFAQLDAATTGNFGAPIHVEDIGTHYDPTLLAWDRNVAAAWDTLPSRRDQRARRMWHFYLAGMAGVFRARDLRLCQVAYARA